jgi:predicted RNA binding protein YcfA (HicA-like mRNA interferase family)
MILLEAGQTIIVTGLEGRDMPLKIRQLKAKLLKAGFSQRPSKGSHTYWTHPAIPGLRLTLAGKDGDDAEKYQILDVKNALKMLEGER